MQVGKLRQGNDSLVAVQRGGSTPEVLGEVGDGSRAGSSSVPEQIAPIPCSPEDTMLREQLSPFFFQEGSNVAGTFPAAGGG